MLNVDAETTNLLLSNVTIYAHGGALLPEFVSEENIGGTNSMNRCGVLPRDDIIGS